MPEADGSNDKKASFSAITKAKMALEHAPTSADNQDKNPELHSSHKFHPEPWSSFPRTPFRDYFRVADQD